jgi:acetylornithine deacetylase/succinyl-diaminopimelate desuccinylase-like protein
MPQLKFIPLLILIFLSESLFAIDRELSKSIFKELISIDTTNEHGDTTRAAQAMAARLRTAGVNEENIWLGGSAPDKQNLVVKLSGSSNKKAILLLAHLDVVEALASDWSLPPFQLTEKDGYFYGRGTLDDKSMAAHFVANLIEYTREGWQPERDIIIALTADEEGGSHNGVRWLLKNHRDKIDAALAINEGGTGLIIDGEYRTNNLQASEKTYQTYKIRAKNPGGHSSRPQNKNAIYDLIDAVDAIRTHQFPLQMNEVTHGFFTQTAKIVDDPQLKKDLTAITKKRPSKRAVKRLSAQPYYNALLRTTCVATMLSAGHAENALPQTAEATINCRIIPGIEPTAIKAQLVTLINNPDIEITSVWDTIWSAPSNLDLVLGDVEQVTTQMWPGVIVMPVMSTGGTDGTFLRAEGIPTFGVSGIFTDVDDNRQHGRDERIGIKQYYEAQEFMYRLVKKIGGNP